MKEKENIINFPNNKNNKSKVLSEQDINGLFLGLVKLVKNNIKQEMIENNNFVEKDYRKALILIADKDLQIEKLNKENQNLSHKMIALQNKLQEIRSLNLKNLEEI